MVTDPQYIRIAFVWDTRQDPKQLAQYLLEPRRGPSSTSRGTSWPSNSLFIRTNHQPFKITIRNESMFHGVGLYRPAHGDYRRQARHTSDGRGYQPASGGDDQPGPSAHHRAGRSRGTTSRTSPTWRRLPGRCSPA